MKFRMAVSKMRWKRPAVFAVRRAVLELRSLSRRAVSGGGAEIGPPRGGFSAYKELTAEPPRMRGRVVHHFQEPPATVPGSLRELSKLNQNGFQPWPYFWVHSGEAQLVGSTLVLLDRQKKACYESMFCESCMDEDPGYNYLFHPPETRLAGNWTSLVARWGSSYYHWLHDALPRLGVLGELPEDTRILMPPQLARYMTESLEMLGLSHRVRPTSETNLVVENFYLLAPTAMTGCYNPYAVEFLRSRFLTKIGAAEAFPKRFFITRRGKTRGIVNEEELIACVKGLGWAVVDTEELSFRGQIELFSQAEAICGLHGAAFANLVWCRPGLRVLELCARSFLNGCYEALAEAVGCEHHFLVFEGDESHRILVDLKRVGELLRKW